MSAKRKIAPIFVVGCQRSGSTMLGSMLGSTPEAITIPEAQFVAELAPAGAATRKVNLAATIDAIEGHYRYKIWQFDLAGKRPSGEGSFADAVRWLVTEYAGRHDRKKPKFWVDQQPGHIRYLGRLRQVFPEMKVIHLVRDGRAVASSLMPLDWGPNTINRAAYYWLQRLAFGFAAREFLSPEQYCLVRYEDILREPEKEMQRLSEFTGMKYRPEMVSGAGLAVPEFTKGQHALVGQGPQLDRIDAWKSKLTHREVEIFESICADMLEYLGYESVAGTSPKAMGGVETIMIDLRNVYLKYANLNKFRKRVRRVR